MKRLELLPFLALLLFLAVDASEASLLARGRTRRKKLQEQTSEAPYVCLDQPGNLPPCNFKDQENPPRLLRSLDSREETEQLPTIAEAPQLTHRLPTTIIYKIEGCLPSRLPFVLPLCKEDDSTGRIVEVRKLFPFRVSGSLSESSSVLPRLVFPEFDISLWHRPMREPWIIPAANEDDDIAQSEKVSQQFSGKKERETATKKTTKRKKAEVVKINDKKTVPELLNQGFASDEVDENDIFSKFPSLNSVEQETTVDRPRDTSFYKRRSSRLNQIVEVGRPMTNKASSTMQQQQQLQQQHPSEFPYAEAIPYDREKLRVAVLSSEFPYSRAIPYDQEKLRVARLGSEFPYSRAISYDSEKLRFARGEKLGVASVDSEFPYSRAIPFDPTKLRVVGRESEFPYSRAIVHYEPNKLEERTSRSPLSSRRCLRSDDSRDNSPQNPSRVIPFDTRMLDAAKEGRVFPYGKQAPEDTSKIVETMEFTRSSGPEKKEVPTRHARKLPIRASRELQENPIKSWGDKATSSGIHGRRFHAPLLTRVTRSPTKFDGSGDTSFAVDSLEVPNRWSEFPYSKAIPFDPEKLRRQRTLMEYSPDSWEAIPPNFPYAKAIPYDSRKLSVFGRKSKTEIDDAATMHD